MILQDRSIAVWDMQSPTDINLRRVLVGHRAAVNVVDFDGKYIVSASGDRTIKVGSRYEEILGTLKSHIFSFDLILSKVDINKTEDISIVLNCSGLEHINL